MAKGICYGNTDLPVASSFASDSQHVAKKLDGLSFNRVYSSPAIRCQCLADMLSDSTPKILDNLMEFHFGRWEGKLWQDIPRQEIEAWSQQLVTFCMPGGESLAVFHQRVISAWDQILRGHEQQVLVICHAGVIRSILSEVLSIPLELSVRLNVDYGGLCKVSVNGEYQSVSYINR